MFVYVRQMFASESPRVVVLPAVVLSGSFYATSGIQRQGGHGCCSYATSSMAHRDYRDE